MPQTTTKRPVPAADPSVRASHLPAQNDVVVPLVEGGEERGRPGRAPATPLVLSEHNRRLPRDPLAGYLPGFDGLRALSILLVLASHAGYGHIAPGGLGVAVFFAISGFLITTLLLNEASATGRIDIPRFYLRRFLRLYPELLAFLAITFAVAAVLGLAATPVEKLAGPLYYMNYYYVFGAPYSYEQGYPWRHLWSLAVEEHFYLFFPLLVAALLPDRDRLRVVICALIAVPLLWRFAAYQGLGMPWLYSFVATEARIDSIAWGCLLALMARQRVDAGGTLNTAPYIRPWLVCLAFAVIVFTVVYRNEDFRWTWRFSIIGAALFVIIANLLFDPRWRWAVRILEWPPLRYIGRISYALYLYHLLVNRLLMEWLPTSDPMFLPLSLILCAAISDLSFRAIEMPLKPLRRRFGSHTR
jgi:peptidoglycan/LPS O-acetylase OafA/YrhL